MPRKPGKVPSYCLHKHTGQAVVRINGQDHYLGKYGSPESREEYARLVSELSATKSNGSPSAQNGPNSTLSINELLLAYSQFAQSYYVKDGKPTKELACMAEAIWPVRDLFGSTLAADFGPKSLKTVRQKMIDDGLARTNINHRVSRIKRVFKWAVAEELISPSVYHGIQAVTGLQYGRTEAHETEPVRPVPDLYVAATLPFLAPQIGAMILVQRLSGMRPCEVVIMRPCDIDTSREIAVYEPHDHKNRWRGQQKLIPLGPEAQKAIEPFLNRDPTAYLFSPKEAEEWRRQNRKSTRTTPIYPSEIRSRAKAKAAHSRRKKTRPRRDYYDTHSYGQAIRYGLTMAKKAGFIIPHWHPYQLRHTRGTEVRRAHGIEAAQVTLGHARADVTEVYAEKNMEAAIRIAKEMG
ncbi:MAG: tyrosine-type recombinase/integrase [Pirellulaceae bacterium]|nr:tyrosine-type recombinase/integrase [Pirellulaceae bacterium]